MKYIVLVIGLLVVGCGKQGPVKELTAEEKKVVGTYEDNKHSLFVLLENGIAETYINGEKEEVIECKWKIVDGEMHESAYLAEEQLLLKHTLVYRINKDGSITSVAIIENKTGNRRDFPKEDQMTLKKIK